MDDEKRKQFFIEAKLPSGEKVTTVFDMNVPFDLTEENFMTLLNGLTSIFELCKENEKS